MNNIKRSFSLFIMALCSCTLSLLAQHTDIRKAMERYKGVNTLTGDVIRTKQNVTIKEYTIAHGHLYFKTPDKACMIFNENKDMLLMDGNTFTMVDGGQKSIAKGRTLNQFEALRAVFKQIISGKEDNLDIHELAVVDVALSGNIYTLTITPAAPEGGKAKRRMMFTSFVLTIDTKSSEFKSLRMNGQAGNYTQYDFSGFVLNAAVSDNVFKL